MVKDRLIKQSPAHAGAEHDRFFRNHTSGTGTGNGTARITTVQGGMIWLMMKNHRFMIKDEKGNQAIITVYDVYQSNGVIFVIDRVLMPK